MTRIWVCRRQVSWDLALTLGNKPRDDLKNWRPILLTSVLYKMATSAIASRLKKVLPDLISNCQTGFIKGRFIGESTRLVYDIMNYTEKKAKNRATDVN